MDDGTDLVYFATDHLSSTSIVMDASGALLSEQRYLLFGEVQGDVGTQITETDFGYTGQRDLGAMGLMDYNARFYSPRLGRFVQPDTIVPDPGDSQAWNRYSYVGNNPLRFTDPTGHVVEDSGGVGGGSIDCDLNPQYCQGAGGGGVVFQKRIWCDNHPGAVICGHTRSNGPPEPENNDLVNSLIGIVIDTGINLVNSVDDIVKFKDITFILVESIQKGGNYIISGPRAARVAAGLNPMTNIIGRNNYASQGAANSIASKYTAVGIGVIWGLDINEFIEGDIVDEEELTASLIWDTASQIVAAGLAGAVTGAIIGTAAPGAGTLLGAAAGFIVGVVWNIGYDKWLREPLISSTVDAFRNAPKPNNSPFYFLSN